MIKFRCPGCPNVYSVEDHRGWTKDRCPSCKAEFIVPGDERDTPRQGTPRPGTSRRIVAEIGHDKPATKLASKRIVAGILALFLGAFGIHKFVLGYTRAGLIHLVLTLATCGLMKFVAIAEGIIYLTKTDDDFVQTYQIGTKEWF